MGVHGKLIQAGVKKAQWLPVFLIPVLQMKLAARHQQDAGGKQTDGAIQKQEDFQLLRAQQGEELEAQWAEIALNMMEIKPYAQINQ